MPFWSLHSLQYDLFVCLILELSMPPTYVFVTLPGQYMNLECIGNDRHHLDTLVAGP
jgi:hypothetical protein